MCLFRSAAQLRKDTRIPQACQSQALFSCIQQSHQVVRSSWNRSAREPCSRPGMSIPPKEMGTHGNRGTGQPSVIGYMLQSSDGLCLQVRESRVHLEAVGFAFERLLWDRRSKPWHFCSLRGWGLRGFCSRLSPGYGASRASGAARAQRT